MKIKYKISCGIFYTETDKCEELDDYIQDALLMGFNLNQIIISIIANPKRKSWVEENPMVEFDYPNSRTNTYIFRKVRVITANADYIQGLDTLDKNRFKKFKRNRIGRWFGKELLTFSTGQMPLFY
jgi:hypothetical protein